MISLTPNHALDAAPLEKGFANVLKFLFHTNNKYLIQRSVVWGFFDLVDFS